MPEYGEDMSESDYTWVPREFKICVSPNALHAYHITDNTEAISHGHFGGDEWVTVIEKRAYDEVLAESGEWKHRAERLLSVIIKEQQAEIERLRDSGAGMKVRAARLAERDAVIADLTKERDQLRKELDEQLLVNGKGQERELKLITERDELKAMLVKLNDHVLPGSTDSIDSLRKILAENERLKK